ncbi:Transferase [Corchorus capsularis]|uniref:Transferase n=1 Tax=Corchorus capsularis TaxID=210143 RepID=A0A1R3JXI4_COCAP|nr:Transferase [Corchorus capsularis]
MADGTVTYMGKRSVVSTISTQSKKLCNLSVLDRLMEPNQVKVVYYYPSRENVEPGEWIKKLRDSLSTVLSNFPIVAGRLQKNEKGHWVVKCNDGGLRMMEAKAKGSVEDWLKSVDRDKELKLIYWEDMFHKPYFWSTFYVQVTEFEKGGVAIGLSCTHLLADPTCVTMFLKAWADSTLSGKMSCPPFFHSLPQPEENDHFSFNKKNPNQDLINYYKSSIERPITLLISNQKYATITLSFRDSMVRDCIGMARATNTCSPAFETLAALFWVDIESAVNVGAENMLQEATKAIGEVVKKMDGEEIKDLIQWLKCNDHNNDRAVPSMNGYDLVCANLEGVNPYLAIFKDRLEPLRVSYYVEPMVGPGRVQIMQPPPGAAGEGPLSRVVMATLPEDEVAMLCKDELIQRFSPTVLMGSSTKY